MIAIDTMHAAGLHAYWSLCCLRSPACIVHQCIAYRLYGVAAFCRRTARQLCMLCISEPVVGKHLLASNTAGQDW
jgi:hypothetical protein